MKIKFIEHTQESNFNRLSNITMEMIKGGLKYCDSYKTDCNGFYLCSTNTGTCEAFNDGCNTFNSK